MNGILKNTTCIKMVLYCTKDESNCGSASRVKRSHLYCGAKRKNSQGRLINSSQRIERQVADGSQMLVCKTAP